MKPLFILEMANNHQGSVEHGKRIISEFGTICSEFPEFEFAFKFQYRDLDTFIHPAYQNRMDIKNVKRFQDTRMSQDGFKEMMQEIHRYGMKAVCTPFDEPSVDYIAQQGYDFIKIASCSFGDWPLMEKIASKQLPVIASAAGSDFDTITNVVAFFENRGISLTLMHCIAEYPTETSHLQLNQIDFYKEKFPSLRIGFSTHEAPDNLLPISMAVAKGASVFEKHVGVPTDEITLNGYSANPEQVRNWLIAAREAYQACGITGQRYAPTEKECADLAALKRGVFAKKTLSAGTILKPEDFFFLFPCQPGQLVAGDLSKYNVISMLQEVQQDGAIMLNSVSIHNTEKAIGQITKDIIVMMEQGNVVIPVGSSCEISHHYGIEHFYDTGVAMIDCINREYCKKILILLPNQKHPTHAHIKKEETFVVLYGSIHLILDGKETILSKGDVMTVERGVKHSFFTDEGCIFEEVSTTHYTDDSIYEDGDHFVTPRKTKVILTKEMISHINKN